MEKQEKCLSGYRDTSGLKPCFLGEKVKISANISNVTFTTLWANSADGKLMICFLLFPENRFSGKNQKSVSICCLLKILPRVQRIPMSAQHSSRYGKNSINNFDNIHYFLPKLILWVLNGNAI